MYDDQSSSVVNQPYASPLSPPPAFAEYESPFYSEVISSFATEYLSGLYRGILGREPDAAGLRTQLDAFQAYASNTGLAQAEIEFASRFSLSSEGRTYNQVNAEAFITGLYTNLLGRAPDSGGMAVQMAAFQGAVSAVGIAAAEAQFVSNFVGSGEGVAHNSALMQTAAASAFNLTNFLTGLYTNILGRSPDGDFQKHVDSYNRMRIAGQSQASAKDVLTQAFHDRAQKESYDAEGFISGLYVAYLHRSADSAGLSTQIAAFRALMLDENWSIGSTQAEFTHRFQVLAGNETFDVSDYLTGLYHAVLGRNPDSVGLQGQISAFNTMIAGGASRSATQAEFVRRFQEAADLEQRGTTGVPVTYVMARTQFGRFGDASRLPMSKENADAAALLGQMELISSSVASGATPSVELSRVTQSLFTQYQARYGSNGRWAALQMLEDLQSLSLMSGSSAEEALSKFYVAQREGSWSLAEDFSANAADAIARAAAGSDPLPSVGTSIVRLSNPQAELNEIRMESYGSTSRSYVNDNGDEIIFVGAPEGSANNTGAIMSSVRPRNGQSLPAIPNIGASVAGHYARNGGVATADEAYATSFFQTARSQLGGLSLAARSPYLTPMYNSLTKRQREDLDSARGVDVPTIMIALTKRIFGYEVNNALIDELSLTWATQRQNGKHGDQIYAELASTLSQMPLATARTGFYVIGQYQDTLGVTPTTDELRRETSRVYMEAMGDFFQRKDPAKTYDDSLVDALQHAGLLLKGTTDAIIRRATDIQSAYSDIVGRPGDPQGLLAFESGMYEKMRNGSYYAVAKQAMRTSMALASESLVKSATFIRNVYQIVLGRTGSEAEVSAHVSALSTAMAGGASRSEAEATARDQFEGSKEGILRDQAATVAQAAANLRTHLAAKDGAALSQAVYRPGETVAGFARVSDDAAALAALGMDITDFTPSGSLFRAALFRNESTGEYHLAFKGTDNSSLATFAADWANSIQQLQGDLSVHYDMAYKLGQKLNAAFAGRGLDFEVNGHSKGGGEATLVALTTGMKANVYNSAALSPATAARYGVSDFAGASARMTADGRSLVDNFVISGDVVTGGQGLSLTTQQFVGAAIGAAGLVLPLGGAQTATEVVNSVWNGVPIVYPAVGAFHRLPYIAGESASPVGVVIGLSQHGMDNVIRGLDTMADGYRAVVGTQP